MQRNPQAFLSECRKNLVVIICMVLYSCLSQELNFAMLTKSSYAHIGVADGHACLRLCKTAELQCSFLQLLDFLSPKKISSDTNKTSSKDVRGQEICLKGHKQNCQILYDMQNAISVQNEVQQTVYQDNNIAMYWC